MPRTNHLLSGSCVEEMTAAAVMESDVVAFERETPCDILAEKMVKEDFGSIPIVDAYDRLAGIVSEYDLLNAVTKGKSLARTTANQVMTQPAVSIRPDMPVEEVNALLHSRHLIRVPVVDTDGRLIGIVARRDILSCYIAAETAAEAQQAA